METDERKETKKKTVCGAEPQTVLGKSVTGAGTAAAAV
jgi:hypothetical protein